MQHLTILILALSAGIAGYAGVTHLLIGAARRPRDLTQLLFGLLSLSVAAHILVLLGVIDSIFTSELAFLVIVIAMSLMLSHGVTQTEIELQTYQQNLHGLVAARARAGSIWFLVLGHDPTLRQCALTPGKMCYRSSSLSG